MSFTAGQPFNPRNTFVGIFIPEGLAASTRYSSTAKLSYGHLVRRAGENGVCWPSIRDIAKYIGVSERAAQRALKELQAGDPPLIRASFRRDDSGRQTSNMYEFIWGPILEGVKNDTPVKNDTLPPVENVIPGGVKNDTPEGVKNDTLKVKEEKSHRESARTKLDLDDQDCSPLSQKPRKSASGGRRATSEKPPRRKPHPVLREAMAQYMTLPGEEKVYPEDREVTETFDAGHGHTEDEIVGVLKYYYNERRLLPGVRGGPRHFGWFPVIVNDRLTHLEERAENANPTGYSDWEERNDSKAGKLADECF